MDILDIFLDILLKPLQPHMGLFFLCPVDFLCEGHHLSKILLGANVTEMNCINLTYSFIDEFLLFLSQRLVIHKVLQPVYTLILPFIPNMILSMVLNTSVTLNNSLFNLPILGQDL